MLQLIETYLHRRELRKLAHEQAVVRQACPHKYVNVGERSEPYNAGSYVDFDRYTVLYCATCGNERMFIDPLDARRELAKQKAREEVEGHL